MIQSQVEASKDDLYKNGWGYVPPLSFSKQTLSELTHWEDKVNSSAALVSVST